MYAVVEYFNYRSDMVFSILNIFNSCQLAIEKARHYAELQSVEESLPVTDNIDNNFLDLVECIENFSTGTGYGRNVYAVIFLPDIE